MIKSILVSRRFWALIVGLFVLFAEAFFPNFVLDQEVAIGFIVIIASYILGVSIDPGPGGWRGVFMSRKFWAALIGVVFLFLRGFGIVLPEQLSPAFVEWAAVLIGTWIAGISLEAPIAVMGLRRGHQERLVQEYEGKKPGFHAKPNAPPHGPASRE